MFKSNVFNLAPVVAAVAVSIMTLAGCTPGGQTSTAPSTPDDSTVSTGQVGTSASTMPKDANTQPDANAADDMDASNDTGQSSAPTVSGTTLSGAEDPKKETPRVVNGKSNAAGSGTVDRSVDTNAPMELSEKTKRDRNGL